MIPITTPPGPRLAGRRLLRGDHDAPPLALRRISDAELFTFRSLERFNGQSLLIHHEVKAIEPVVPGGLLAFKGNVRSDGSTRSSGTPKNRRHDNCRAA